MRDAPLQFWITGWALLSLLAQIGTAQTPPAEPVDFMTPAALIVSPTRYAWGAVLSPDKSWVAVSYGHWGNEAGRVCVFDVATGKPLWSVRESRGVRGINVSPDGTLVASGNFGGEIHLRDSKTGQLKKTLQEPTGSVEKLAFSPDGRRLATGSNASVAHIWDLATGQIIHKLVGHTGRVYWVDYSPDGKLLVTGSQDQSVRLWDAQDGKLKQTWQHPNEVSAAVFLPDGKQVASVCHDGLIRFHNAETGNLDRTLGNALARILGGLAPARQAAFAVAVSQDGSTLAASVGVQLEIWALPEGRLQATLPGHSNLPFGVSLSKDGKTLASAGWDAVVKIWDVPGQKELKAIPLPPDAREPPGPISASALSPDGAVMAVASERIVELRDRQTGAVQRTLVGHEDNVLAAAISPDGKWLATAGADGKVLVWNMARGQLHKTLAEHTGAVNAVAWSADSKLLASGGDDKAVQIWNAQTFANPAKLAGTQSVRAVAFAPDGRRLFSGGDDAAVQVWDLEMRAAVGQLTGHTASVRAVAVSPDGATIASAGDDLSVRLWNAGALEQRAILGGHQAAVLCLAFSPRGQSLASGAAGGGVHVIDPVMNVVRKTFSNHVGPVTGVAFLPGAAGLISSGADRSIRLWKADVPRQQPVATLPAHAPAAYSATFSPDGKWLATGGANGQVALRDPASGEVKKTLKGHSGIVYQIAFSPDYLLVATAGSDGTVRLWSIARAEEIMKYNGYGPKIAAVRSLDFSPNGKWLVSGGGDGTLKMFDVDAGKVRQTLTGQALPVNGIKFTPDSQLMVTCTGNWQQSNLPGELRLWEVASGRELARLDGHPTEIKRIDLTADGKRLISAGSDRTVIVWDLTERKVLSTFKTESAGTAIALLPDGQRLAAGDGRGGVNLYELTTGKLLTRYAGHAKVIPGIAVSPSGKLIASASQDGTLKLWAVP